MNYAVQAPGYRNGSLGEVSTLYIITNLRGLITVISNDYYGTHFHQSYYGYCYTLDTYDTVTMSVVLIWIRYHQSVAKYIVRKWNFNNARDSTKTHPSTPRTYCKLFSYLIQLLLANATTQTEILRQHVRRRRTWQTIMNKLLEHIIPHEGFPNELLCGRVGDDVVLFLGRSCKFVGSAKRASVNDKTEKSISRLLLRLLDGNSICWALKRFQWH